MEAARADARMLSVTNNSLLRVAWGRSAVRSRRLVEKVMPSAWRRWVVGVTWTVMSGTDRSTSRRRCPLEAIFLDEHVKQRRIGSSGR